MEPIDAIKAEVVVPWGVQVKKKNAWYPQEICNEWPHHLSALSLGESSVVKFGVSYPLRTGLGTPLESDFPEYTSYFVSAAPVAEKPLKGVFEEVFVSRGICLLSEGPIGGPSFIKGFYRPELSYSTGIGIKDVVKAKFPVDTDSIQSNDDSVAEDETFLCLVEKGGISIFAENSSETFVAYMPDFHIEKVIPCKFGLLVVPSTKGVASEGEEERHLYVLTHPIKQVSKIGQRCNPITDFIEYDTRSEKLLWCEGDICIFWSLKNDKFTLRRLYKLEKRNVGHGSTLNASMYYTTTATQDQTHSPFTPAGGSSMYSPLLRSGHNKASAMRINREGGTVYYWPSFDFSETAHGFNAGFFPPHIGIYDDPELYLKLMFHIELNHRAKWKEPKRFQVVSSVVKQSRITLVYLIKTGLYVYCIDVESGERVSHYSLKGIQDFVCSSDDGAQRVLIVLTVDGQLKIAWLDNDFSIAACAKLEHSIIPPLRSVEHFFDFDTIICGIKDDSESKAVIKVNSYLNNSLISRCMSKFSTRLPSKFVARLAYKYVSTKPVKQLKAQWNRFTDALIELLLFEKAVTSNIISDTYQAIESIKEDMKLNSASNELFQLLEELSQSVLVHHKGPALTSLDPSSLLQAFAKLLVKQDPKSYPEYESLPEVMQILLEDPDNVLNLEKLVKVKTETSSFIPVIDILLADVFQRNQTKVHFSWPESAISVTGRIDYLSGSNDPYSLVKDKVFEVFTPFREKEDAGNEPSWITHVLNMRVFSEDRRLEEVCRLLDSASALSIDVEQRAEMSDHEYVEEQEKHLLQLVQITFAAPVGRAAFTLRTEQKNFANLTSGIYLPKMCLSGKCAIKGTNIELNENDLPPSYTAWPNFHNAVASSLSVSFLSNPADAWFAHNKARMAEGSEQAGMILGFGLNGILSAMPPTLRHEYLSQENSYTTMAMLLGLCANLAGTGDISTWKVVSLHIGAMLPACTTELEIPRLATLVAPFALGLLFVGTHNSHVAKVLLGEISKKYSPLSIFGGGNGNSSAANVNQSENNHSAADREAHSLCSGFGLGYVNLGKGRDGSSCLGEDGFDGILRRFVVGGPKPTSSSNGGDDDDMYNQYGQSMPSLWEEYRCCHIEEGDNVNVDVTTPSAIIAVALTYLRSGNEAVIKWLSPPNTLHLLDGVRPDVLMLRSLASILVYESIEDPRKEWLEFHLMPDALSNSFSLKSDNLDLRIDRESIVQAWASIICGYCLGLGIRYAGTSEQAVVSTLWGYTSEFLKLASLDSKGKGRRLPKNISEYFPKNFLESCVCTLLMAISLVNAGTGNVKALRLCRFMQSKIANTQITSTSNTYGMEMCIAMATGILFLGGGRYSLSNDDRSIAVLLAAVFPKWPINANDNRYHLQALRHLYVLAAQPRLILPRPLFHNSKLKFKIEFLDGRKIDARAPILLPPLHLLKRISLNDRNFLTITFNLPGDLPHLKEIVEGGGVLNLVPKPIGHMKQYFLPKMSWRDKHALHPTFEIHPCVPTDEFNEVKEINCISRIAESSGLTHIIPSLVALRNGDTRREDWLWQLRVLYIWVTMNIGTTPSLLRMDLIALLLNKAPPDFKMFGLLHE